MLTEPSLGLRCGWLLQASLWLPLATLRERAVVLALLGLICALTGAMTRVRRAVRATRWFMASIVIASIVLTPGVPIWTALPGFTREGARDGLHHLLLLLDLLLAVAWLLHGVKPQQWLNLWQPAVAAKRGAAVPRILGIAVGRLALALEMASAGALSIEPLRQRGQAIRRPDDLIALLACLCVEVEQQAAADDMAAEWPASASSAPQTQTEPARRRLLRRGLKGLLLVVPSLLALLCWH